MTIARCSPSVPNRDNMGRTGPPQVSAQAVITMSAADSTRGGLFVRRLFCIVSSSVSRLGPTQSLGMPSSHWGELAGDCQQIADGRVNQGNSRNYGAFKPRWLLAGVALVRLQSASGDITDCGVLYRKSG